MQTMGLKNHNDEPIRQQRILRYIKALEDGDVDTLFVLLEAAEVDPELDRLISEVHQEIHEEAKLGPITADAQQVRQLLRQHLPSGFTEFADPPPLTVGDIAVRLVHLRQVPEPDQKAVETLLGNREPLPPLINRNSVNRLASQYPVVASDRFWRGFRETAITVVIGRAHQQGQLAAARQARARATREEPGTFATGSTSHDIAAAVRQVLAEADNPRSIDQPGIVPLDDLIASYPLRVAAVPSLDWQHAAQFLSAETGRPIILPRDDRQRLSGLLYCAVQGEALYGMILVNQDDRIVRQRFSVAHELGHYVLHFLSFAISGLLGSQPGLVLSEGLSYAGDREDNLPSGCVTLGGQPIPQLDPHAEDEANEFAAQVLMPEPAVRAAVSDPLARLRPQMTVRRLAGSFLVSPEAMRRRLVTLDLADDTRREGKAW